MSRAAGLPASEPAPLALVPLTQIQLQEAVAPARARPLAARLAQAGVQRDPVLLARLPSGSYLQLDGATRLTALRSLGCRAVCAQVVDYADPQVRLLTWAHRTRLPPWDQLGAVPITALRALAALPQPSTAAVLLRARRLALVPTPPALGARLAVQRKLLEAAQRPPIRLAWSPDPDTPLPRPTNGDTVLLYAPWTKAALLQVVEAGDVLPAGLTRHLLLSGRVLQVQVPLAVLRDEAPAPDWLAAHLARRQLRRYDEPTLVYEEA